MPPVVTGKATLQVGVATVLEAHSPSRSVGTVFEDDGQTGYFYGLDYGRSEQPIVDALHIYNVAGVIDPDKPSFIEIIWSSDGWKAALLVNSFTHAVFDFEARRGYCRTGFPERIGHWTEFDHAWSDEAIDLLR